MFRYVHNQTLWLMKCDLTLLICSITDIVWDFIPKKFLFWSNLRVHLARTGSHMRESRSMQSTYKFLAIYNLYTRSIYICSRRSSLSRSLFSRHPSPCTAFSQSLLVNSLWWRIQGERAVKAHIFTCTTWPETLWSRGIMRPRD